MALAAGTRCGPYEIASLLGTGGMGEVYRARDLRLDRNIAIKLLRDKLERGLEPARQTLTNSTAATVWFEGWTVTVEKSIEELLMPHSAAVTATRGSDEPAP